MTSSPKGNYARVNGINLYYETYGTGSPLVLVHGSFGTTDMFAALAPELSKTHTLYLVELQAHGHTEDIDRPFSFEAFADDIAALINHLGIGPADILGYSFGGGVATQTAIRHPELIRNLIVLSFPFKSEGWYPDDLAGMRMINGEVAKTWVESPMYKAYAAAAPNPDNWPALADKLGVLTRQSFDWTESVATIKAPTLIITGDVDGIRLEHVVEMFRLLGVAKSVSFMDPMPANQLSILPGTTHLTITSRPDLLLPVIIPFLSTQSS